MWEIYDALIDGIPRHLQVDDIVNNGGTACVRSGTGIGIGMAQNRDTRPPLFTDDLLGQPLYKAAECIKSWNLTEASAGHAAINAYYNSIPAASGNGVEISKIRYAEDRLNDPFIAYQNQIRSKTVGVIGHFHYLEQLFAPVCNLLIFENEFYIGDYPEHAAEYLLPECEYVFISCSSLSEKTLPRFLELSKEAYVVMVGPATTLAPVLFDFGIHDLSGFVVKDNDLAYKIVSGAKRTQIYKSGQKVSLKKMLSAR